MTELAQQIIEKERAERTGYLDLGRCGLTELPDLSDLEWLETLIISNGRYDNEQDTWVESQNKFDHNYLSFVPDDYLPKCLKKLILSGPLDGWGISDGGFLKKLTSPSIP